MIEDGVIVDTAILIEFFKGTEGIAGDVSDLLQENRLVITGIVLAELLQGMKNLKEELLLDDFLLAVTPLEITTDIWLKAGRLALSLRRKGITLPLTDVAIAAISIEYNLSIFTLDKHFEQIPNLKIYK
ncbi:MAG: PIN domain-containing protein [Nitrospirota bacterium]